MRLHRLDLNLLMVFDAVLYERSVRRASERLNLSQPAISSALGKLRHHFGDELLVMKGRGLSPTPFALSLKDPVQRALAAMSAIAVMSPRFDPATDTRVFRVVASEGVGPVLLPRVVRAFADAGPGMSLIWLPNSTAHFNAFQRGESDLMLLREGYVDLPSRALYDEDFCCLAWTGYPLGADPLTLEAFEAAGHVAVMFDDGKLPSFSERRLADLGVARRIVLTVNGYSTAPAAIIGTSLLVTVPRRMALACVGAMPLRTVELPLDLGRFAQCAHWHGFAASDPGLRWLLDIVSAATG